MHCSGGLPTKPTLEGGDRQGTYEREAKRVGVEGNGRLLGVCQISGHEFEQILGDSEGQGSLVLCSPWGHKESYTTERLNNNK